MRLEDEYRLSEYEDLGKLENRDNIRLKRHKIYGNICAEKRVPLSMEYIYRFIQEHPTQYIPKVQECIADEEVLIVIEEYIPGRNLEEMLHVEMFSEEEAVRILVELCEALKIFHHADPVIICRDLKAENVMLDNSGNVKIIDFDIARIFREGQNRDTRLLGTAGYAAPEQYGYFQTDNRTDIYALGVLLNYMTTRKFPVEQMVSGFLARVVKKCTYLDPKDRYQSVEELEELLKAYYPQFNTWRRNGKEREDFSGYDSKEKSEQTVDKTWNSFLPPGFRSGTPWKMAVAALTYFLITVFCFRMEMTADGIPLPQIRLRFEQAVFWFSQIVFIGIVWDYRGCRKYCPIFNQRNLVLRIVLYVLLYVMLFVGAAIVCALVETVLSF